MSVQWSFGLVDRALSELCQRLDRLVGSMKDQVRLANRDVAVSFAAAGVLVPHHQNVLPKAATAQLKGTATTAATVRIGAIDDRFVRVYVSASCTIDLYVVT